MPKGKRKAGILKKLRGFDLLSWFFIVVLVLVVFSLLYLVVYTLQHEEENNFNGDLFYEKYLNFTINLPHGWQVGSPDETVVAEEVRNLTGGVPFDMRIYRLTREIVPLALIQKPIDGDLAFSRFLTFSFKGSDSRYSYLQDKVKLMDDFRALMGALDHTDIEVEEVYDFKDKLLQGIMLEGSGVLGGQKIYYRQYFEAAGANILTVTYGFLDEKVDWLEDLQTIVGSLVYLEGGVLTTKPNELLQPSNSISIDDPYINIDDHDHDGDGIPDHGPEAHDDHDHDGDGIPDHEPHEHVYDLSHDHDGDGIPDHGPEAHDDQSWTDGVETKVEGSGITVTDENGAILNQ